MKLLLFLLSLILPSFADGYMRNVPGKDLSDADRIAINQNFRALDAQSSRTTIKGYSRIKVGTFTSSGSTGDQAVTGVGFRPRGVILAMGVGAADSIVAGLGFFTPDDEVAAFGFRSDDTNTGGLSTIDSAVIRWSTVAGVAAGQASYVSMDTDGFTINWSVAEARTIAYMAFQ